jgi:hypothetical protein
MAKLKSATERLYQRAVKSNVQFPKKWKETTKKRACSATLVSYDWLHSSIRPIAVMN